MENASGRITRQSGGGFSGRQKPYTPYRQPLLFLSLKTSPVFQLLINVCLFSVCAYLKVHVPIYVSGGQRIASEVTLRNVTHLL